METIYFVTASDDYRKGRYMVLRKDVWEGGRTRVDQWFAEFFSKLELAEARCEELNKEEDK